MFKWVGWQVQYQEFCENCLDYEGDDDVDGQGYCQIVFVEGVGGKGEQNVCCDGKFCDVQKYQLCGKVCDDLQDWFWVLWFVFGKVVVQGGKVCLDCQIQQVLCYDVWYVGGVDVGIVVQIGKVCVVLQYYVCDGGKKYCDDKCCLVGVVLWFLIGMVYFIRLMFFRMVCVVVLFLVSCLLKVVFDRQVFIQFLFDSCFCQFLDFIIFLIFVVILVF